ncbi:MAG: hypothetical protein ACYS30_19935, partial [Planctomycetota bacterium]
EKKIIRGIIVVSLKVGDIIDGRYKIAEVYSPPEYRVGNGNKRAIYWVNDLEKGKSFWLKWDAVRKRFGK